MAKRIKKITRSKRNETKTLANKLNTMLTRKELWIGVFTVFTVLCLGLILAAQGRLTMTLPKKTVIRPTVAVRPTATPTIAPTAAPQPAAGEKMETVRQGDSYAQISERVCKTQKYYAIIAQLNNGKDLYPGYQVRVRCSE